MSKAKYSQIAIEALTEYKNNARTHSPEQVAKIARSIQEFGFINPVLINKDNVIMAGHGRVMAAKELGMTEVPCLRIEHLTEAQMRAYVLADNKLAEEAGWDLELVKAECGELNLEGFDVSLTGFEFDFGDDWFGEKKSKENENFENESDEYKEFVEKFEQPKTTDDCYTPDIVYDAVKDWAVNRYGINEDRIVRPFFPGGDYQNYAYANNAIVLDNPPFSIISEIIDFYTKNKIKYFLFCPGLTSFSRSALENATVISVGCSILYENGALVPTSFLTNLELGEVRLMSAPDLYKVVDKASREFAKEIRRETPKYTYPDNVVTAAMCNKYSKHGIDYKVNAGEFIRIGALDSQKEVNNEGIFGGGLLVNDLRAAEKAAAEKAAAEKAAAEKAAAEKAAATKWELSDREKQIIKDLSRKGQE